MKKTIPFSCLLLGLGLTAAIIYSCSDDSNGGYDPKILSLSTLSEKVAIGDSASVEISLLKPNSVDKIIVEKSNNGIVDTASTEVINAKDITFPYTYKHQIENGDEDGMVVYSFYAKNSAGKTVDAADLVLTVDIAQLPLLLKYDWQLVSQTVHGEDTATPDLTDDIQRFNDDMTWQVDWGTTFSAMKLETLNSYCAWQVTMEGSAVKTLSTIHYNIFTPTVPVKDTYNVVQLSDKKMILESFMDLSAFGSEYSDHERVLSVYEAVNKSTDFTPYRGSNPESYYVSSCDPGTY
jgi:hypothetical protein